MLGELTGEEETDGSLDLSAGDGVTLVVAGESAGLNGESLEDVVDKGVHDAHGLLGDAGLGVDLTEHLVDEARVARVVGLLLGGTLGLLLGLGLGDLLGGSSLLFGLGHFFKLFFCWCSAVKIKLYN